MSSSAQDKKRFRAIGHKLKPIVTIAQKGISATVQQELERALHDHELIKVRIAAGSRADKLAMREELLAVCGAECIQQIGHVLLLYRPARKPDPKLSNLLRPLD
jgi:RNA-binding protein